VRVAMETHPLTPGSIPASRKSTRDHPRHTLHPPGRYAAAMLLSDAVVRGNSCGRREREMVATLKTDQVHFLINTHRTT
jgi:hypothetical protein